MAVSPAAPRAAHQHPGLSSAQSRMNSDLRTRRVSLSSAVKKGHRSSCPGGCWRQSAAFTEEAEAIGCSTSYLVLLQSLVLRVLRRKRVTLLMTSHTASRKTTSSSDSIPVQPGSLPHMNGNPFKKILQGLSSHERQKDLKCA